MRSELFQLSENVNKQDFRNWKHDMHQKPLHNPEVTERCTTAVKKKWRYIRANILYNIRPILLSE